MVMAGDIAVDSVMVGFMSEARATSVRITLGVSLWRTLVKREMCRCAVWCARVRRRMVRPATRKRARARGKVSGGMAHVVQRTCGEA